MAPGTILLCTEVETANGGAHVVHLDPPPETPSFGRGRKAASALGDPSIHCIDIPIGQA